MRSLYNRIAGQNLERLAALSDGVFAVAMTLLVLDLRAPAAEAIHSERELAEALLVIAPRLVPYLMSFLTLGIFWLVINALMLWLTSALADPLGLGFHVSGFWAAFLGALVVSIVGTALAMLVNE